MKWRKWNNIIHRDLGYFFFGLTIIYAISGITANHLREWDSNFIVEKQTVYVENVSAETTVDRQFVDMVLNKFDAAKDYKSHFRPSRKHLQIFINGGSVDVDLDSGMAAIERKKNRPVFREFNYLHLNQARKMWTWVADIYAVALFLLALTGLFVLKGKKGLKGRGKWITAAGILLPIIFLIFYFY